MREWLKRWFGHELEAISIQKLHAAVCCCGCCCCSLLLKSTYKMNGIFLWPLKNRYFQPPTPTSLSLASSQQSTYKSCISLQSTFWRYILFIDSTGENRNCLLSIHIDAQHIYVCTQTFVHAVRTWSIKCLFDMEKTRTNFLLVASHIARNVNEKEEQKRWSGAYAFRFYSNATTTTTTIEVSAISIFLLFRQFHLAGKKDVVLMMKYIYFPFLHRARKKEERKLIAARLMTILKILWWQSSARSVLWTNATNKWRKV